MTQNWFHGAGLPRNPQPTWDYVEIDAELDPVSSQVVPGTRLVEIRLDEDEPDDAYELPLEHGIPWPSLS